jgi:predicted nucleic acid-binding protein
MKAILDTGPWVALIDRSKATHDRCVKWFKQYTGKMYSTEAVLTEVLYLLNFAVDAQTAAMDFVLESVVELIPVGIESLNRVKSVMLKYADVPMDYADATIVCLAMETGIRNVITLDKKDFSIYKIKKQPFVIMP